jgi:hypothetical protein
MSKKQLAAGLIVWVAVSIGIILADDISGTIKAGISISHAGSGTASTLTETLSDPWKWGTSTAIIGTNGSATGLSKLYVSDATIAGSGTNTLDLYGALTDSFGVAVNLARVKLILIAPANTMAGQSVTLGASASNGMTNALPASGNSVLCGGAFFLAGPTAIGYSVSNGVCDTIQIVNDSTNAATCKVIVAGE